MTAASTAALCHKKIQLCICAVSNTFAWYVTLYKLGRTAVWGYPYTTFETTNSFIEIEFELFCDVMVLEFS